MVNKMLKLSTVNELVHQLQTRRKKTDTASLWEPPAVLQRHLLLLELLATLIFYFSKKITGCLGCSIRQSCLLPRKQTPASSPSLSPETCADFTSPLLGPGRSRQRGDGQGCPLHPASPPWHRTVHTEWGRAAGSGNSSASILASLLHVLQASLGSPQL